MTYSIVARCPHTGQLGIGVQSHVLAVGRIAPYAAPGIGVVATQSIVLMAHGQRVLDGMRAGMPAGEALNRSLALDEESALRQVGVVDAHGRAAAFTGDRCIPAAGHVVGDGYAAQANIAASAGVWEAMGEAFESAPGPLAMRLVAALEAAEAGGGELRGVQSAAVVVVTAADTGDPLVDRLVDVRVDDSPDPLRELRRLTGLALAYDRFEHAERELVAGHPDSASRLYDEIVAGHPDQEEFRFWHAVALARAGYAEAAAEAFAPLRRTNGGRWNELVRRLVAVKLADDAAAAVLLRAEPGADLDRQVEAPD